MAGLAKAAFVCHVWVGEPELLGRFNLIERSEILSGSEAVSIARLGVRLADAGRHSMLRCTFDGPCIRIGLAPNDKPLTRAPR